MKPGRKTILLPTLPVIFLLLSVSFVSGAHDPLIFQASWGAGSRTVPFGEGTDSLGNIYVAGTANMNKLPDYIGAQGTVFLLKFDSHGVLLWQRSWLGSSGVGQELGGVIAVDPQGNVFLAATTPVTRQAPCEGKYLLPGILLLKFDTQGSLAWQKTFAGPCRLRPFSIALSKAGNLFVAGLSLEETDPSHFVSGGPFLMKLSPDGNFLWGQGLGDVCICAAYGVAVDSSENAVVTGDLVAKFDSVGSLVWQENIFLGSSTNPSHTFLSGYALAMDQLGNIYDTGNGLIVELDSSGSLVWARQWAADSGGAALKVDGSNNIFLAGSIGSRGPLPPVGNTFLIKLDPSGTLLGQTVWEGPTSGDISYKAMAIDSYGHVFVSGAVSGRPPFNSHYDANTMKNATAYIGGCNRTRCGPFTPDYTVGSMNVAASDPQGALGSLDGSTNYGGQYGVFLLGYDAAAISLAPPSYASLELVIGMAGVGGVAGILVFLLFRRRGRSEAGLEVSG